ncbi:hypothetical protein [Zeaxanthinibacter enoshimensis]|uniref:Uncharacterized protein n=1 Tax=Zeaxanthinibacter enoshimensis TaxID=392009 RepID=A0A4R6TMA9_9FLAO|nr:hypothetical protein [Zeaxanthinibacter enoshimensis]TDQ32574.1 hypothetical protein CLV82_0407 [Zeaxanthinibacter enoshimensis]
MKGKKIHWGWNVLIVVTILICIAAFIIHYKNWVRVKPEKLTVLSGIYYRELPFADLDSVAMVDRLPELERIHGFSAWSVEKGIFLDSIHPDNEISVFVDNLRYPKIRLVHKDSLLMYLNFRDTVETRKYYDYLLDKLAAAEVELPVED